MDSRLQKPNMPHEHPYTKAKNQPQHNTNIIWNTISAHLYPYYVLCPLCPAIENLSSEETNSTNHLLRPKDSISTKASTYDDGHSRTKGVRTIPWQESIPTHNPDLEFVQHFNMQCSGDSCLQNTNLHKYIKASIILNRTSIIQSRNIIHWNMLWHISTSSSSLPVDNGFSEET